MSGSPGVLRVVPRVRPPLGDLLTNAQSRPLATTLAGLGVEVTTLFYPPDHQPGLAHEYQFDLDNADGQNALAQMLRFLKQHTSTEAPPHGAIGS